jgi:hypothetical protein
MLGRLAAHLGNQWMGALALLIAVSGTAYAAATITGADVVNDSLTGKDIREGTLNGVTDRCPKPATVRKGTMCVGSDGNNRGFFASAAHCESLGLRLPTYGEARWLATKYDLPGVGSTEYFWTDELEGTASGYYVFIERDTSGASPAYFSVEPPGSSLNAVCVRPASDAR